jgi:hypothetical protein
METLHFASQDELAAANSIMMLNGGYDNETVLLTGPRSFRLEGIVEAINEERGTNVLVKNVNEDEYVAQHKADTGGKSELFFNKRVSWFEGVKKRDGATVDPALTRILGMKPLDGVEVVKKLLTQNMNYNSKQNYAK